MHFLLFVFSSLTLSLCSPSFAQTQCNTTDVQIDQNTILRGCLSSSSPSVSIFNIRYASQPARWTYSTPLSLSALFSLLLSSSEQTNNTNPNNADIVNIIDATATPPQCFQNFPPFPVPSASSSSLPPFVPESEDCLFVTVWVPTQHLTDLSEHRRRQHQRQHQRQHHRQRQRQRHLPSSPAPTLPILFYIPGGAFQMLAGIDGEQWLTLTQTLIVVNVQYRVNLFGFFSTPGLDSESVFSSRGVVASGNFGLLDQVTALHWMHDNIAALGGDKDRITIAGQSAGSMSVCHHLASPVSHGLFSRAILESGACTNDLRTRVEQQTIAEAFASTAAIGCALTERDGHGYAAQLACLRNVSAASLQSVQSTFVWDSIYANEQFRPVVDDNYFIKQKPKMYFQQGTWNQVPLIVGSVAHEIGFMIQNDSSGLFDNVAWSNWSLTFRTLINENITTSDMTPELQDYYSEKNEAFWNVTQAGNSENAAFNAMFDAASTFKFQCPNYFVGRYGASAGQPVYVYTFNYASPNCSSCTRFGAVHGAEIAFVYDQGQQQGPPPPPLTPLKMSASGGDGSVDDALALTLSQYWIRFIVSASGNPNDVNAGVNIEGANTSTIWPALNGENGETLDVLEVTTSAEVVITKDYHTTACKLWAEL